MLCPYALNSLTEQLNKLKVDDDGITLMERFSGTTTNITIKNLHTWACKVYVLDTRFQGNIAELPKWEPRSREVIYLGHSQFHAG